MKDFYKVLGLQPTATSAEIKRTFKELAKNTTPTGTRVIPTPKNGSRRFRAYDILGNPESRKKYDEERELLNQPGFHQRFPLLRFDGGNGENVEDFFSQFAKNTLREKRKGLRKPQGLRGFFHREARRDDSQSATLRIPLNIACGGGDVQVSGLPGSPQTLTIPGGTRRERHSP